MNITATIMSNASILPPYCEWGVIGGDLPSNSKPQPASLNDQTTYCTLSLYNLSPSDDGNYTITARNAHGTSTGFAYFEVVKSALDSNAYMLFIFFTVSFFRTLFLQQSGINC